MQSQLCTYSKKYIFPLTIRRYYLFCGPVTFLGLLAFALFMLFVAWIPGSSTVPCCIIGILFVLLSILFAIIWCVNFRLIRATYLVDGVTVHNQVGTQRISLPLCGTIHKSLRYNFNFGYASFTEEYTIISSNSLTKIDDGNIYKIVRKIWGSGSVILPVEKRQEYKSYQ